MDQNESKLEIAIEKKPRRTGFTAGVTTGNRCHAKSKHTGMQCKKLAVNGFNVCVTHGAGSPKRREAKMRKQVLESSINISANNQYFKSEVLEKIELFRKDKDLNNLDFELAYLKSIPSRIENNKDLEEVDKIMLLEKALKSIFDNMEKKEKITEARRYSIGIDKLQLLVKFMFSSVQRHVKDPKLLSKIANDLRELANKTENTNLSIEGSENELDAD